MSVILHQTPDPRLAEHVLTMYVGTLTLTPANYARAIISLSKRYSSTSVFPGNNYIGIGEWLRQDRSLLNPQQVEEDTAASACDSRQPHDLVVIYNSGERKWDVQQFSQDQHEDFTASICVPEAGSGHIVFMRGFISPAWLSAIGSKYHIDPEFFRRHMDFLSTSIDRHAYSFPSLATSSTIIRLCVSTILHRDDFGAQDLQTQRLEQTTELTSYRIQQLGSTRVRCGDSLVREYSTVCPRFSVLEQWISLFITKTDEGWAGKRRLQCHQRGESVSDVYAHLVIAWMDHGRPLESSPPGPWTTHLEQSKATPLPILQHHPQMAFRTTKNRLDADLNGSAAVQQSTTILPLQYDSLIALVGLARRAPHNPLSVCIPLFAHAAFSEVQFLNLMESRYQDQINAIAGGVSGDALGTLQSYSNILNRHAQQLQDNARALSKLIDRSGQNWGRPGPRRASPGSTGSARRSETLDSTATTHVGSGNWMDSDGVFTPHGLLEAYEQLHLRCVDLSDMCARGITLAMSKATIEESRKGIEQSGRLKRLTLLATIFIPLNFTASLFGMNVDLFGQSTVEPWWFFVLCVPITLFTYFLYLCDLNGLRRRWKGFWSRQRVRGDRGRKDPSQMV